VQRKAYVSGVAALLVALLAGCTGGSSNTDSTDDANPGGANTATAVAQPGKYRTLPGPCSAVSQDTLDSLLPGIKQIADADQREKAYGGEATLAYDNDRKAGCRWKVDSSTATDRLLVDFENRCAAVVLIPSFGRMASQSVLPHASGTGTLGRTAAARRGFGR